MKRQKVVLLGFCMALAFGLSYALQPDELPEELLSRAELIDSLGPLRPVRGRFAGVSYAPYIMPAPLKPEENGRLSALLVEIRAEEADSTGTVAALVLVDLLDGKPDRAIARLERVVEVAPNNGYFLSDLSALYFERLVKRGDGGDLLPALATAEKAIKAAPALPEAYFNLALILDHASLLSEARQAWTEYLRLDPDSEWADEARRHLRLLERLPVDAKLGGELIERAVSSKDRELAWRLVARFPRQARLYAEKDLLARWAEAVASGRNVEAQEALKAARVLGAALVEVSRDYMISDSIALIDKTSGAGQLTGFVEGHCAYGEALASTSEIAEDLFRKSAELLRANGSPFQLRAQVRLASSARDKMDHKGVLEILSPILPHIDAKRYPIARGEVLWLMGTARALQADYSRSVSHYRTAMPLLQPEKESLVALRYMIAESLRYQGETRDAWKQRYEGLRVGRAFPLAVPFHNTLLDSAEAALKQDLPDTALRFQDEMVHNALSGGALVSTVESFVRRSRTLRRLGRVEAAARDLDSSEQWLERMEKDAMRDRMDLEIQAARGEVQLVSDPEAAAESFSRAIARFRDSNRGRMPILLLRRAQAWIALGKYDLAEEDLEESISEYERQREQVPAGVLRISQFDQARQIFRQMIEFQIEHRRDSRQAFAYAERSRMRSLLDTLSAGAANVKVSQEMNSPLRVLDAEEIQDRLPNGVTLIEYSIGERDVFVWMINRRDIHFMRLAIDPSRLRADVAELRRRILRGVSHETTVLLRKLFDALYRPLLPNLAPQEALVFVPDELLYNVPFAGLINAEKDRFLIEDRWIGIAMSATLYVELLDRKSAPSKGMKPRVLIMGDPALDRRQFPDLAVLSGAEREAIEVAVIYGAAADLFTGAEATKDRFLSAAPAYDIIHLATHAKVNDEFPFLSALLLASSGEPRASGSGALYAHEISQLRLPRSQLVILAACEGGGGPVFTSEGLSSLVRPFLAAGAPAVAASLWPLEDEAGADVLGALHRELVAGSDPTNALRAAQLKVIMNSDLRKRVDLWAGLQVIGGDAPSR